MKNRSGRFGRLGLKSLFGKGASRAGLQRALRGEQLEHRHLMAGDTYLPYHNDLIPEDTNGDYNVTALDALLIINAINAGRSGPLSGPTVGKASGPAIDVSGDNILSALDALKVINRLNAEGEDAQVGYTLELTDKNGVLLQNNTTSVGTTVYLRAYVQDLRPFGIANGVYGAHLDVDYSDGSKFVVNAGEVQAFRFRVDGIDTSAATNNFTFSFRGQSVTVNLAPAFNGATPRAAVATAIQTALSSLSTIGAGNVLVRIDDAADTDDATAQPPIPRWNFTIQFINDRAADDVPLVGFNPAGVAMLPGQTLLWDLVDRTPADPNNPQALVNNFLFDDAFPAGRQGTRVVVGNGGVFDEVGASRGVGGIGGIPSPRNRALLFAMPIKALAAGTVTFTPNAADDPASETLTLTDAVPVGLQTFGAPITLTIASSIAAVNDTATVAEDTTTFTEINVTQNDTLISGTSFSVTSPGTPSAGGTVNISSDGRKINYRPAPNFFGTETFVYTVTNNLNASAQATVTVTVTQRNDAPTVQNQSLSTNLGKSASLTATQILTGASAGPNEDSIQTLSLSSATTPSANGGIVSLNGSTVTYTPATGFSGSDTFLVVVTDNGLTNGAADPKTATATVTVTVTNDAPVANNDLFDTIDEGSTGNTLDVLANDSAGANDVDSLTIITVSTPANGTAAPSADGKSIVYSPNAGFAATDTFTYTVRDLGGLTAQATVTVEVKPGVLPRAVADRLTTAEDSAGVTFNPLQNDRVTQGSTAILKSFPPRANNGTITQEGNLLRYVPDANFFGTDTFEYVMNETPDIGGVDSIGRVTITVTDVNDAPILVDDTASTPEDTVLTIPGANLTANDSPGNGEVGKQTLTVDSVQAVSQTGGTVVLNGTNIVFTPTKDFVGTFVFSYVAKDSGTTPSALTGTANVTITVTPTNDNPIAGNDSFTVEEDKSRTITFDTLRLNDAPGPATAVDEQSQGLSIISFGTPSRGGTAVINGSSVVYTPALDFFGTETFTYLLQDSAGGQATGTVTMTVTAVNDKPITASDSVGGFKGVPITIAPTTLLANDAPGPQNERDIQTLSVSDVSNAIGGTVALVGGQIVFTPAAGFTGAASFRYTARDNGQTNGADDFQSEFGTVDVAIQEFVPSSISGTVFFDETNDGIRQATERAIGGVTVQLVGTALGLPVSQSYITMADGSYRFSNLAPGTYTVSYASTGLIIDGKDSAGALGDSDGLLNNNSFTFTIANPGGSNASGYNFAMFGIANGYNTILERLASRLYAPGTNTNVGLYATVANDGSQQWFAPMDGFAGIQYARVELNAGGTTATLTIVDSAHNVRVANLSKGMFLARNDASGNTIVRVLGGLSNLQFTQVTTGRYVDALDAIFAQQGWL